MDSPLKFSIDMISSIINDSGDLNIIHLISIEAINNVFTN